MATDIDRGTNTINVNDPKFGAQNFEDLGKGASNGELDKATALQAEMQQMQTLMQTMTRRERNTYRVHMNERFKADGYNGQDLPKMEFMQDGSLSITSASADEVKHKKGSIQFDLNGGVEGSEASPLTSDMENSLGRSKKPEINPLPEEKPSSIEHSTPAGERTPEYWTSTANAVNESRTAGKHFKHSAFPNFMEMDFANGLAEGIKNGASDRNDSPFAAFDYGRAVGAKLTELCKSLTDTDVQALEQRLSGEFRASMQGKPGLPLDGH